MRGSTLAAATSAVALVIASLSMPSFAEAGAQPGTDATAPADIETDAQISARLSAAIRAEIGNRLTSSSTEDLEGYMMFVLSQRDYTAPIISSALDSVGQNAPDNLKQAVSNIRIALLRRKVNRGTAALIGSGGGFGVSSFTSPGLSVGGGSSNYTF